ncbi:ankyrin repeat domain-containing protein [Verrucomicrobiaceae bacterium N1E253]|uniref:Ankyrin repeat domain-containing protein n=1 Tax=Oceaniferula marina TaxID=2748318 RepID=A0A851GKY3_9BACT|nr:ankyrin repeat domain-containing protein [Oceaniferula marina]NWK57712.1 ankyrin repeat domain-containing protein [Oceaniferula marina]
MNKEIDEAIFDNDSQKIAALIKEGLDPNWTTEHDGWNMLHQALVGIRVQPPTEIIQFLIDREVDLNAQDVEGWTPLHFAVRSRNLEVVKLMINYNLDIELKNNGGDTALAMAFKGLPINLEIIKLLLSKGASSEQQIDGESISTRAKRISEMKNTKYPTIYDLFC